MTVIRPNSVSGITSITAQANEINFFRSNGLIAGLNLNGVNFNTTAGISTLAALKVTGNLDVEGVLTYQDVTNVDSLGIGTFRTGINVSGGQLDVGNNIKLGNAGVITATSFVGSGINVSGTSEFTANVKFDGSTAGRDITFLRSSNTLRFQDNAILSLGDGDDFKAFHNGTDTRLVNIGGGTLKYESDNHEFKDKDNGDVMMKLLHDGAVELYHDNAKRIETLSSGARVVNQLFVSEGTINLEKSGVHHHRILMNDTGNDLGFQQSADNGANTNFTTYLRINDGGNISLPVDDQYLRLGASGDLKIYHNGTDSYVSNSTNNLRIGNTHDNNIKFFTNNSTRWNINGSGHFLPDTTNSFDIGTTTYRVRNIYTNDLNLSNEGGKNDVDGTWGNYTIQEGESDLFLINKRNGKKYKFNLTEVS